MTAVSLTERLTAQLTRRPGLLPAGSTVLVAVSGGGDSTALAHLLCDLSDSFSWRLVAAHFDHGSRADGAERAALVEARLPRGMEWMTNAPASRADGTQNSWRDARYRWLAESARATGATRIATGHHEDDQLETILFRVLRGTGNRGLVGIPAQRGPIVRPLLRMRRDEIRDWLDSRGILVEDDPANHDRRHARSRIRHDLLPALESSVGPRFRESLLVLGRRAADVESAMSRVARRAERGMADGRFAEAPPFVRAEALRRAARRHGLRLRGTTARRVAAFVPELASGHGIDLGAGLRLEREFEVWRITPVVVDRPEDREVTIPAPKSSTALLKIGGRALRLSWSPDTGPARLPGSVALFVGPDHYPLTVRARQPGDRIRLSGGSRTVSRLLAADRVPASARDAVPLVTARGGTILCVLSDPVRIAEESRFNANLVIEVEDE